MKHRKNDLVATVFNGGKMAVKAENVVTYSRYIFWCLFFFALILRLWGIWNVSSQDEYNEIIEALRVCSGHLNFERWTKRFYLYILAFEYGIYYGIGWIFNVFASPMDFSEKIARNMAPLFIIGRITSAIAGAFTVGILYKIGDEFFSRRVALVSSLLLAVTPFHISLSQQAKVDALLGLLVVAAFYFIFKLLSPERGSKWDYAWCGFLMALAIQTKINSVVLVIPFAITVLLNYKIKRHSVLQTCILFSCFFIIGFVVGNPPVLLAPVKYLKSLSGLGAVYTTAINVVPNDLIGFLAYPFGYYRKMGAVVSLMTISAFIYTGYRLNKHRAILLSFISAFYIMMGSSKYLVSLYYMIPVVPFIFLLIGDFTDKMLDIFATKFRLSRGKTSLVLILILTFALLRPVLNIARHEISLSGKNTRYLAKEWIEANITPGSRILMDSGKAMNTFAPPIAENREALERTLRNAKKNIAEKKIVHGMVDKNALIYYRLLLKTIPEKSYDITSTMAGLKVKPIDYYVKEKYQHFIISRDMKISRTSEFAANRFPGVADFYSSLDSDPRVKLIKVIAPSSTNKGDTFYIYRIVDY